MSEQFFIRFVQEKDFLIDDIENGFALKPHHVKFEVTPEYRVYEVLCNIWRFYNLSNDFIDKFREAYELEDENEFYRILATTMRKDPVFKTHFKYHCGGTTFKVPMKCFTELRHNQKVHYRHVGWFGQYGIMMTKDWILKNGGDRVIYVKKNSELSKRVGTLAHVVNAFGIQKDMMKSLYDVLSFVEHGDNEGEFEWRVVGEHKLTGSSGKELSRLMFSLGDIAGVYVKSKEDIDDVLEVLKQKKEKTNDDAPIPQIYLTDDILLTPEEIEMIEKIKRRG